MAEAIGLASGLVTLIICAYETTKSVYNTVSSFKSQQKAIKDVLSDLESLLALLTSIRTQAQCASGQERLEPLRQPLNCCMTTCQEMREMLDACMAHTTDDRKSIRDWLRMQYHEKGFNEMKQRLASYKSSLSIAFDSINIQDNAVTQDVLNDLKDLITGTREDLEYQLDQVREAISTADASLHETLQSDIDQLQSSLDSIKQAQRVTDSTLPMVFIKNNEAEQDSRAFFGTDMQPQWHLNVSGNKAGRGAVVSAGAYSSETLQALLETSRTPDIAHMFRALQPQLRNAHNQPLQSILHALSVDGQQGLTGAPPKSNFPTRMTLENANTLTVLGAEHPVSSMHGVSGNEDEMHR